MARITGTRDDDLLDGTSDRDVIIGGRGDDTLRGGAGDDFLRGDQGFDNLNGGSGNDRLFGGAQNDNLQGGGGNDYLSGDNGRSTAKGTDLGSDRLDGGDGNDVLAQGDGNDTLTGGDGMDTFAFRFNDPMVALAAGTGRAFATITDFNVNQDRLTFDAAGVGNDLPDANFVDGGAGDGTPGGVADSFYKGGAAGSNGESVVVLDEEGFATGADAVLAAQGEQAGDLILYFNTTVGVASLLYVDSPDMAHSIARFTDTNSVEELQNTNFQANDFFFV